MSCLCMTKYDMKYRRYRKRRKVVSKAALARHYGISVRTLERAGAYSMDFLPDVIALIVKLEGRKIGVRDAVA